MMCDIIDVFSDIPDMGIHSWWLAACCWSYLLATGVCKQLSCYLFVC